MFRIIFYILIIAALLSACSPSKSVPLGTPIVPEEDKTWTIKMEQSGGIMGLSRSIEISADGKYTVTDQRANKTVKGQLSAGELSRFRELATTVKAVSIPGPEQTGCADCFIYTLKIEGTGNPFSIQSDDVTLPKSGLEPLVSFLRDLMDKSFT